MNVTYKKIALCDRKDYKSLEKKTPKKRSEHSRRKKREWYSKNKEIINKLRRENHLINPERQREYFRRWGKKNRAKRRLCRKKKYYEVPVEERRAKSRKQYNKYGYVYAKYRAEHREQIHIYNQKYRAKNADKINSKKRMMYQERKQAKLFFQTLAAVDSINQSVARSANV